jgi:uncharacterized protein YPO0396
VNAAASAAYEAATASYVLTHLELYDWGAFGGRHCAEIDLAGTAIIGPTGSGKTTLVDALMTLLCAQPRYNLASTGGHESDRDLVSYVRGVSGAGNESEDNAHIARPGAVVSAVSARFCDGHSVVRLGGLFWFDGSSSAAADLKRRWILSTAELPALDDWLAALHDGGDRALKQLERETPGLRIYGSKREYLARLRTQFEVAENAFALLNRAAGLKQLSSIDVVFRELVLDDRSAFDAARHVAEEFDTLAGIRQELELARRQRDALSPIARDWKEHAEQQQALELQTQLQAALPIWFAQHGVALWKARIAEAKARSDHLQARERELATEVAAAEARALECQAVYLQSGGTQIEALQQKIDLQKEALRRCARAAADYQSQVTALDLDPALGQDALRANQDAARRRRADGEAALLQRKQRAWDAGAAVQSLEDRQRALHDELEAVRQRPGSNIPIQFQQFRSLLAEQLGVDEEALPFVAELVEVREAEQAWRGAIERALGSERLRILIDPSLAGSALDFVNARDNRLHVRLREAHPPAQAVSFFADGFTRKLNFRAHPHREALKQLLAGIDRHCVEDVATLRRTAHAMTLQGLMSGREGWFDKQDQKPLDRDWMTGFDNRDQLARLQQSLQEVDAVLGERRRERDAAQREAEDLLRSLGLLQRIEATEFADIDAPGAQRALDASTAQLEVLTAADSEAGLARQTWERAEAALRGLRQEAARLDAELQIIQSNIQAAQAEVQRLMRRIGEGLQASLGEQLSAQIALPADLAPEALPDLERQRSQAIQQELGRLLERRNRLEQRLVREMGQAKVEDSGALSEVGSELQDVPAYLARLRELEEEALPEKQQRFLAYLNQSSDQGVTQLLGDIDNEVSLIEERIADLNTTLERVDFQPGRYLRLEPRRVEHESLRSLQRARARLRSDQLKDDQGESHYRALADLVGLLREAVERRKTVAAQALLDPRYRLQFAVWVIERDSGRVIEKRTSSQGGSGGEKEIIASYVLTASLSYALCPAGSSRPLFGSIVLDEAFSKSSQAVAGRIIRALGEFGLHPLFVTPNKELRLLREHTRSAIVVHRRGAQASLTSLSWEVLAEHARQRLAEPVVDHEIAD